MMQRSDYIKTRPSTAPKVGSTGQQVRLFTNYFEVGFNKSFEFVQYRVDFLPETDNFKIRKALVYQHAEKLRGYVYDGDHIIYLMFRLPNQEFVSRTREGDDYKITLKSTGTLVSLSEGTGLMVFNIMLRRAMDGLKLQEVQRNLYDPNNAIDLRDWKVQLWPGYITSIRQHEQNVLLCCEISHKVMRYDTCLNVLQSLTQEGGDFRAKFEKDVVGTVVLTDYNNKTYSIAGVNWEMNPASRFTTRQGEISFSDYYRTRYNLPIRDQRQPLLIARLSARDIRGGREQQALLVPELCRTTGLTDGMRQNFQMMKALGEYTRMEPTRRVQRLLDFSRRFHSTPECMEALSKFNVSLETPLLQVSGRFLPPENILFGNDRSATYEAAKADWTPAIRNNSQYSNVSLKKWIVIYPKKIAKEVNDFLKLLVEVANGLGYEVAQPKKFEIADDRVANYYDEVKKACHLDPKMIMCFFMGNQPTNAVRYATVKKLTYVTNSIPSQCILAKTITPKRGAAIGSIRSVATKVVLQLNSKLGGAPWMVSLIGLNYD
jgi:aubergine